MGLKVGINGFGRIGRNIYRAAWALKPDFEIVAVNDIGDAPTFAHLLKHDTALGTFEPAVKAEGDFIHVDGHGVKFLTHRDPTELPWHDLGVDLVVESTGLFTDATKARVHIDKGGAKKVIISAPATHQDFTVVMGVNHKSYDASKHHVISNASCTTNCFVPLAKVLHDSFGIERGMMTTIHAYTADQRLQDMPHRDLHRARAAALNLIPTTTGAAKAVGLVLPELNGKLNGLSVRAPVVTGSVVDLVFTPSQPADIDAVNAAVKEAAEGPLKGILSYTEDEIVSTDVVGDPHSSIFDAGQTMAIGDGKMIKAVSWYDNEWGYSNRCVELAGTVL
jgi:glyceraldehyde 3-phosphate dehydrogenase (phosphorylating)